MIDFNYIKFCIEQASRGKKKRRSVQKVLNNIDYYAREIQNMVISHKIRFGKSHQWQIREYGKTRDITSSPFYPNHIIDYMIVNCLKEKIRKSLYAHVVGNIDKKGIKYGRDYLRSQCKNYTHFVKLDIHHFYQSVSPRKLMGLLRKRIKDEDFLFIVEETICRFDFLPIGAYYSQWLSNFYLMELDWIIKQELKIPLYIRYVDDMLLMGSKEQLSNLERISEELVKLGLKLKKTPIVREFSKIPISFLGFRFFPQRTLLRREITRKILKTCRSILRHLTSSLYHRFTSYWGWITSSDLIFSKIGGIIQSARKIYERNQTTTPCIILRGPPQRTCLHLRGRGRY